MLNNTGGVAMRLKRAELADLAYSIATARHGSFRQVALEMGVTAPALSHAIAALEARRRVRLLNRTTCSVSLTAAGEELRAAIDGPMEATDSESFFSGLPRISARASDTAITVSPGKASRIGPRLK